MASCRVGGGHVKAASGSCLSGDIWTQQLTFAMSNDFALWLPGAGPQDLVPDLIRDFLIICANRASIVVVLKVTSTEERRIGKDPGSNYTGSFRTTLALYVATERVLSPGGRESTPVSLGIDFRFPVSTSARRDSVRVLWN